MSARRLLLELASVADVAGVGISGMEWIRALGAAELVNPAACTAELTTLDQSYHGQVFLATTNDHLLVFSSSSSSDYRFFSLSAFALYLLSHRLRIAHSRHEPDARHR